MIITESKFRIFWDFKNVAKYNGSLVWAYDPVEYKDRADKSSIAK